MNALMNVNLLKLCANVVEILSFEAPQSRAVVITPVQVTTVSVINDSHLAETGSLCWGMCKTRNGTPVSLNITSVSVNGVLTQCKLATTTVSIVGC